MSYKLVCVITGKTTVITEEYYNKKVKEFGSTEKLEKKYVCRQAKTFLIKGYSVNEIRKILKTEKNVPTLSIDTINEIIQDNNVDAQFLDQISIKKSDPEVSKFIETLKGI